MIIDIQLFYLIIIFVVFNFTAFFIMLADKIKSTKSGSPRISEGKLFFMATFFAALGVYLSMFVFRHKTRKWYFLLGIPLLIGENIITLYYLYFILFKSFL
jgi:uncharacterized membrane protein YsdA (DUF1294 family)